MKESDMNEACSTHGEMRNAYKILFGKSKWKRLLGIQRYRWEV